MRFNPKCLLILMILPLFSACVSSEVCDTNGEIFESLRDNAVMWVDYFTENPDEDELRVEIADDCCIVYKIVARNNEIVLQIATQNWVGPNATPMGKAGYYYNPTRADIGMLLSYDIRYLENGIFCYTRQ